MRSGVFCRPAAVNSPRAVPGITMLDDVYGLRAKRFHREHPNEARGRSSGRSRFGMLGVVAVGSLLVIIGLASLELVAFPRLDAADAQKGSSEPLLSARSSWSDTIAESSLHKGMALTPVPFFRTPTILEAETAPESSSVDSETATVQGAGISLHAGPRGTDPIVATRSRGMTLRVFARQDGWIELGDDQPIGWGWGGLLSQSPS